MKKISIVVLVIVFAVCFVSADRQTLRMVANVPVQTYSGNDTFVLDSDDKNIEVRVTGATAIEGNLYQVEDENVTLNLSYKK